MSARASVPTLPAGALFSMASRAAEFALRTTRKPAAEVTLALALSIFSLAAQKACLRAAVVAAVLLLLPHAAIPKAIRASTTIGMTYRLRMWLPPDRVVAH